MKPLLFLLLTTATLLGQGGSYCSYITGDPRLYANKFGLVAYYGLFDTNSITLNGAGASKVLDKTGRTNDLLQGTAANQPLVSRADNKGNLLVQSSQFSTTWSRIRVNAFGATDTGAAGAGSFANTTRTTDPLGGNTADFIQEDSTAANSHFVYQGTIAVSPGTYIYSVYAKTNTGVARGLEMYSTVANVGKGFDLVNLTSFKVDERTDAPSATITSAGNGWALCSMTVVIASGSTSEQILFGCTTNTTENYNGDNTSGLYLWGASLRQSTWDSDYIATTSTIAVPGLNGKTTAYFDGANHYLKTAAFTLNQPTTVIWVGKQVTWTYGDTVVDGNAASSMRLYQRDSSPEMLVYAGSDGPKSSLALGAWGVAASVFNGASSSIQINNGSVATGNCGASNAGGFTLGARGVGDAQSNIQVSQVLLFNRALLTNELAAIWKWAQGIGGTALAF